MPSHYSPHPPNRSRMVTLFCPSSQPENHHWPPSSIEEECCCQLELLSPQAAFVICKIPHMHRSILSRSSSKTLHRSPSRLVPEDTTHGTVVDVRPAPLPAEAILGHSSHSQWLRLEVGYTFARSNTGHRILFERSGLDPPFRKSLSSVIGSVAQILKGRTLSCGLISAIHIVIDGRSDPLFRELVSQCRGSGLRTRGPIPYIFPFYNNSEIW
jgi:hypothetical protein